MNSTEIDANSTMIANPITKEEKEAFFNSPIFIFVLIGIILAIVFAALIIFIIRKRNSSNRFREYEQDNERNANEFRDNDD